MSKFHPAFFEEVQGKWFVWAWLPRWNRYVNTHVYEPQQKHDAVLTIKGFNR